MRTKLIINARAEQAEIALLQDDRLTELILEKSDNRFSVGDIYLGRVKKLASGLNAAFVDVGYAKDAFLHYHDLGPQIKSWLSFLKRSQKGKQQWSIANFKMQPLIDKNGSMDEVLKTGQEILVQIAKEPISTKGPRITSEISLPGRYVVLVPFSDRISISQKIRDRKERDRLRNLAKNARPKGFGVILRTVAIDVSAADLENDIRSLMKKWRGLHKRSIRAKAPARASREMNRASAFLRDVFNESFEQIVVDNAELAGEMKEFLETIEPGKSELVHNFRGKTPIFQYFGVDRQIKSSFGRSVSMPKGAYLIIEHTEAMHVVDVNSGNRTSSESQEDNALATNMLAAEEIARQLRLRDMGGIIVIDFIDMHKSENKKKLFEHLRDMMKNDRAKHKILPLSRFGVMEITRQRVRPEMNIPTREENPDELVEAPILKIEEIEQSFEKIAAKSKSGTAYLHVHPFIFSYLTKGFWFKKLSAKWQKKYGKKLVVQERDAFKMLEYHFYNEKKEEIS